MPGLQEWIYRLEEGAGARILKVTAALLGFIALAMCYDLRAYKNFSSDEAMENAQLARNVAEGKGFTTQTIRPLSLYLLQKNSAANPKTLLNQPIPDLSNPPVYPALLGGLMKIFPFKFAIPLEKRFTTFQPEMWITFFNQVLFFVAAFLLFKLARRLFDNAVAWLTAAIFAGSELFWRFSISGISTLLLVVILLGVVWCLVLMEQRARENPDTGLGQMIFLALTAGALVGLGGLTRYSFCWLILPVIFFLALFLTRSRLAICVAVGAAFLAVMTPWLARNYSASGTLFGTAGYAIFQGTAPFPENQLERSLDPENDLKKLELDDYVEKILVNTREILQNDLPKLGGSWLTAFFLVGLLIPFRNPALSRLRIFLLGSMALFVFVQALGKTHLSADAPEINSDNLLVIFAPLVFAFGVALFFTLLEQAIASAPELRYAVTGLFWLVACAGFLFVFLPPGIFAMVYPPYYPPIIQESAGWMNEKELMMSDVPGAVAWYGRRQCLWLTAESGEDSAKNNDLKTEHSFKDFFKINNEWKSIQAFYLTQRTMDSRYLSQMVKANQSWGQFVFGCVAQGEVPSRFPLKKSPSGFLPDQLYLSDRDCVAQDEVQSRFPLKKSPSEFLPDQLDLSDRKWWQKR